MQATTARGAPSTLCRCLRLTSLRCSVHCWSLRRHGCQVQSARSSHKACPRQTADCSRCGVSDWTRDLWRRPDAMLNRAHGCTSRTTAAHQSRNATDSRQLLRQSVRTRSPSLMLACRYGLGSLQVQHQERSSTGCHALALTSRKACAASRRKVAWRAGMQRSSCH